MDLNNDALQALGKAIAFTPEQAQAFNDAEDKAAFAVQFVKDSDKTKRDAYREVLKQDQEFKKPIHDEAHKAAFGEAYDRWRAALKATGIPESALMDGDKGLDPKDAADKIKAHFDGLKGDKADVIAKLEKQISEQGEQNGTIVSSLKEKLEQSEARFAALENSMKIDAALSRYLDSVEGVEYKLPKDKVIRNLKLDLDAFAISVDESNLPTVKNKDGTSLLKDDQSGIKSLSEIMEPVLKPYVVEKNEEDTPPDGGKRVVIHHDPGNGTPKPDPAYLAMKANAARMKQKK